jgi:hypothetical protein
MAPFAGMKVKTRITYIFLLHRRGSPEELYYKAFVVIFIVVL